MTGRTAADLPLGSVVAGARKAWVKVDEGYWHAAGTNYPDGDDEVEVCLEQGAQVLRVGDGKTP